MTRRPVPDDRARAYTLEQTARRHRTIVGNVAALLKARGRAAHLAGLGAVTITLTAPDARLVATALTEWVREHERRADTAAQHDRKERHE